MKIAVLYSGGKDSNFVVYKALREGYRVSLLITLVPESEDSMLFHHPNILHARIQAECMNIPIVQERIKSKDLEHEMLSLFNVLRYVKEVYGITHILSGGISSRFQNDRFKALCDRLDLSYNAPLWRIEQSEYMYRLLDLGFEIMISAVSADGLDHRWLGKILDKQALDELIMLSKIHGFNPAFEGGEAETFVLNAPHFKNKIIVRDGKVYWDGVRGIFSITSLERVRKV